MRTRFADTAQHANAFFVIRAISGLGVVLAERTVVSAETTKLRVFKNFFRGISFCIRRISLQPQHQT